MAHRKNRTNAYYLLSLGCAKNTVDSESMAALLEQAGLRGTEDADRAEVLIVNTCGFIGPAREESINALRELAALKKPDQYLIAAGCLSQRFGRDLPAQVPELDGVIGTRRWMDIVDLVRRLRDRKHPQPIYHLPDDAITVGTDERGVNRVAVQGASAYLKIADGCRRPCAFCAIPGIKGTAVSRPVDRILDEARALRDRGVKELILIAQDTTDYGHDLGIKDGLGALARTTGERRAGCALAARHVRLSRLRDGSPDRDDGGAPRRSSRTWICRCNTPTAARCCECAARPTSSGCTRRSARCARPCRIWRSARRSSSAIRARRRKNSRRWSNSWNRCASTAWAASRTAYEPGTPSADLPDQVDEDVKNARRDLLMSVQQPISLARNQALVGRTLEVLVEGHAEATAEDGTPTGDMISLARSYRDAPEIDGYVLVEGELPVGELVPVRVTGAMVYDLIATPGLVPQQVITLAPR